SIFFLYNINLFNDKKISIPAHTTAKKSNGDVSPVSTSDFEPDKRIIANIEVIEAKINLI
ncbi:hypothetical protein, partial [Acinetobacter baumannii]|uniref:hypothetical protein n=1 Tax=Acinetobacter baumannii TaxID=470 RepID=UPI001BB43BB5